MYFGEIYLSEVFIVDFNVLGVRIYCMMSNNIDSKKRVMPNTIVLLCLYRKQQLLPLLQTQVHWLGFVG